MSPAADRSQSDCKHYADKTGASLGNFNRKSAPRQAQAPRYETEGISWTESCPRKSLPGVFHLRERCRACPLALADLPDLPRTWCRIFPTWPARFFSTCSRQTKRHGQSLLGHLSRRSNCFRRSRTRAFSRTSSASRSVSARVLPFVVMNLMTYSSLSGGTCHLNRKGFTQGYIKLKVVVAGRSGI